MLGKYSTLQEIISVLETTDFPELTWVAKNYNKSQLIEDLKQFKEYDASKVLCTPLPDNTW